ncbi:hypothetical protein [Mycobacterium gordonae]|uniref:Uncharacterized protein n=1 Tax=Mycobacterium gordonae TaxID=1778 RepID=A0A1X1WPR7_MYCGO|nr:hypothetical protein [Mycobacterium gordonae]MCV7004597.1 hypothetical protein [Mycobacterium gordonae]ODR14292.1 hypothetical protein BHQ23_33220 [Mycobacterium gordonae]ORV88519.1 hypothetical protein AWC08_22275 [Mycobacterium gordonae]
MDVRAKLAEALAAEIDEHGYEDDDEKRGQVAWHFADVLLSLEGVAIVAVPEGAYATVRYDRDALIAILNAQEAAEAAADAVEAVADA